LLKKCKIEDVFRETNFGTTPLFMADKRGVKDILLQLENFTKPKMSKEQIEISKDKSRPRFYWEIKTMSEEFPSPFNGGVKV